MSENKANSYIDRIRQRAREQASYGGDAPATAASIAVRDCSGCGAARAWADGLTHCAFCGFEFIATTLSDGVHITADQNSQP